VRALQSSENPEQPVVLRGKFTFEGGAELARKLLDEHPDVTAIFAANDVMAFGVAHATIDRGLRIPEDLSLIGFDNLQFSVIAHPPLTTIHQPKYEMGSAAVDVLLRLARDKGKQIPEHRRLGVELIERQSCKEPRAGLLRRSRRA
jgi:LacI family transcriptional regulator